MRGGDGRFTSRRRATYPPAAKRSMRRVARERCLRSILKGLSSEPWFNSPPAALEAWREGDPLQQVFWLLGKLAGSMVLAVSSGMRLHAAVVHLSLGPCPVVLQEHEGSRWGRTRRLLHGDIAYNRKKRHRELMLLKYER
jgi:hypothetical protein